MKKIKLFTPIFLAALLFAACSQKDLLPDSSGESPELKSASLAGKYIVVLKKDESITKSDLQSRKFRVREKAQGLLKKYEITGEVEEVYQTALQGFAVKMSPGQMKKIEADGEIAYIEADKVVSLSPIEMNAKPGGGGGSTGQSIPWGITRVGGGATYTGTGVAWVIDTGIDLDHPDLNVDVSRSTNFAGSSPDDQNGHGTHVAGIIAAKNNTIGVVGVAAGATVISVRVLGPSGSGTNSGVIAGVDYVAANGTIGDVANMSLGGGVSQALDDAVLAASNKGVKFSLAAGNESDNANNHSPARVNGSNIYTISAMASGDKWASYSNFGNPPVDYCAPGSSVYSCYKGGAYATLSGTSMAAPHVAGILLWGNVNANGTVKNDPDGKADSIAHL